MAQVPDKTLSSVEMFDGQNLEGWEGEPGWWTVEDGAITARSTPDRPCTRPTYLYWKGGEPADFVLDCEFRISAEGNSGIQIRSQKRPNWDTFGYQADMTGDGSLVGFVYHHQRGLVVARGQDTRITPDGKVASSPLAEAGAMETVFKRDAWNAYQICCDGARITLLLNGVMVSRVSDEDLATAARSGIIALQMHPGPPMSVQFRKLRLTQKLAE